MDSMSLIEVQERARRINTLVRFHKVQEALNDAYALRLDVATSTLQTEAAREALAELEVTIAELERQKFSRPVHKARALLRRLMGVG